MDTPQIVRNPGKVWSKTKQPVGGEYQAQGYEGDDNLSDGSYEEGAHALFGEFSEVGS